MADEPIQDEDGREPGEGKVLPKRELMSVIGTDPADPLYSALVPSEVPVADAEGPPQPRLPIEEPETQ